MKTSRSISAVVAGIGISLGVIGLLALSLQLFSATPLLVLLPDAPAQHVAVQVTEEEQGLEIVKLASSDASVSYASANAPAAALPGAPIAQDATATPVPASNANAPVIPTVDVAAAIKQFQAAYPVPEKIWIEKIKVDAKIQPVGPGKSAGKGAVEWTSPNNKNVGWHDYSGRMGEGKNIVLNGHNNIHGAVFRKLYTLQAGDEIRLGAGDLVTAYKVEEVLILKEKGQPLAVRLKNAEYIQPMVDDRLTIVSCWPENNNTHRVIVIARPVK